MRELTEQQAAFAAHFVANGGNGSAAAASAGYAAASAAQAAYKLVRNPAVQAAILAEQKQTLGGKLANKALAVLEAILDNDKAPFGARVDAAKTILDRGGLIAPKASDPADDVDAKPISEMSLPELEAFIRGRSAEILDRAGKSDADGLAVSEVSG